ncbi:hypothetical protein [Variovorax sp. dw_308]|uniref:hypothetical protein n=1 Tax=Variovorax sp. dw_308 TaxID=2721546 RepID=UPI001C48CBBD|nr:hypothetical protein [Variovorax sp. dw_308]
MIKNIAIAACACLLVSGAFARGGGGHSGYSSGTGVNSSSHSISGYSKSNGTYVAPSHATNPNSTRSDNYSTRGNFNPYTGKPGTK